MQKMDCSSHLETQLTASLPHPSADESPGEEERGSGKRRRSERKERSRDRSDRRRKDSRWAGWVGEGTYWSAAAAYDG